MDDASESDDDLPVNKPRKGGAGNELAHAGRPDGRDVHRLAIHIPIDVEEADLLPELENPRALDAAMLQQHEARVNKVEGVLPVLQTPTPKPQSSAGSTPTTIDSISVATESTSSANPMGSSVARSAPPPRPVSTPVPMAKAIPNRRKVIQWDLKVAQHKRYYNDSGKLKIPRTWYIDNYAKKLHIWKTQKDCMLGTPI